MPACLPKWYFGGSAPLGASLSFDSEVARRSQDGIAPFVSFNAKKRSPVACGNRQLLFLQLDLQCQISIRQVLEL